MGFGKVCLDLEKSVKQNLNCRKAGFVTQSITNESLDSSSNLSRVGIVSLGVSVTIYIFPSLSNILNNKANHSSKMTSQMDNINSDICLPA